MNYQVRSYITALALSLVTTTTLAGELTIHELTFDVLRVASGNRVGYSFHIPKQIKQKQTIKTALNTSDCSYGFTFNYVDSETREVLSTKIIELTAGESDKAVVQIPSDLGGDLVRTILVIVKSSAVIGDCPLYIAKRIANHNGDTIWGSGVTKIVGPAWKDVD